MNFPKGFSASILMLLLAGAAFAQPATAPSVAAPGPAFQSLANGISLRAPEGAKIVRGPLGSPEVATFNIESRGWVIKLTRIMMDPGKPLPLTLWKDKDNVERAGVLEWTIEQIKAERPGMQIIGDPRVETINRNSVGMFAARFSFGLETTLLQEALIRVSDMQYFLLSLTCPAPKTEDLMTDPKVQVASEAFSVMLESVELLDQTVIRKDQDQRLLHTRELFTNIKSEDRLRRTLEPRQFLRFLKDGKDVGYSYTVEESAHGVPHKGQADVQSGPAGILVGTRARMMPEAGVQIDSESWYFCTYDGHAEDFNTLAYTQDVRSGRSTSGEVGSSRWREKPIRDTAKDIGAARGFKLTDEYKLEVTKIGLNISNEPIARDLPPYYLPQAFEKILPRFIATRGPKTYLFASWVTDASQVVYRFIDVEPEREVSSLPGRRARAIPVKDRVGLEGPVTTHYVTTSGQYLGSVNEEAKTITVITDAKTIESLYSNSNLTRPAGTDRR